MKKLKLQEVKVKSFVTALEDTQKETVIGGEQFGASDYSCQIVNTHCIARTERTPIFSLSPFICADMMAEQV